MAMTVSATIQLNDMMSITLQHITSALNIMIDNMARTDSAIDAGFDSAAINDARVHIDSANAELAETEAKLEKIRQSANNVPSAMKNIETSARNINNNTRNIGNSTGSWADRVAKIGAGYIGARTIIDGIKAAMNLSDANAQTTARLGLIVDDGGSVEELEAKIRASAERSRASYQTTADAVSKLGMQAGDAFNNNDELVMFTELLNKSFVTAGTSAQGIDSVMLQLTQSMASGRLQGEELNAVLDNAQPIVANIQRYLEEVENIDASNIKELASEGVITAETIKNAMFYAADDINAQFEEMPVTWGQVWIGFIDDIKLAFKPFTDELGELAQSENIQNMLEGISNMASIAGEGLAWLVEKVDGFVGVIQDNWEIIRPILLGLAAIWAVIQVAILLATIQQWAYNIAMYACPIVWIIVLVIAFIAIIFAAAAAIAKFTGVANSAFGVICGTVATAGAFVLNIIIALINAIIEFLWSFVDIFIGIIEWIINVCEGGFDSFGDAVANLIGQIISWFLSLGKVVTTIIDAIFGFDWTGHLESLQATVTAWGKNEDSFSVDDGWHSAPTLERIEYSGAWELGANFGDGVSNKIQSAFGSDNSENDPSEYVKNQYGNGNANIPNVNAATDGIEGITNNTAGISDNTEEIAENTKKTNDLMEMIKDNWEKKLIKEYTSKATTITYDLSGMQNTYNNTGQNFNPVKEVERYLKKKAAISTEGI